MEREQATKFVHDLLTLVVKQNASDLFITAAFPPAIRNLIRESKVAQMYSMIQAAHSHGMHTLDQHLQELVRRNIIPVGEARNVAVNKDLFLS